MGTTTKREHVLRHGDGGPDWCIYCGEFSCYFDEDGCHAESEHEPIWGQADDELNGLVKIAEALANRTPEERKRMLHWAVDRFTEDYTLCNAAKRADGKRL